jgi:FMN phosphatase YigB (HAD superfamily)
VKLILFDLGNTLENDNMLVEGAKATLSSIKSMQDSNGNHPTLALISDFDKSDSLGFRLIDVKPLQIQYYQHLESLGISEFFQPLYKHVTLSTEVGIRKPAQKFFRFAIDTIEKDLPFEKVLFITEDRNHILSARQLGMKAIHVKGPGQDMGDVDKLLDIVPLVHNFNNE